MTPASVSVDRVRAQRTWRYCRFQLDQLSLTLASARHLALHEVEAACQQRIDALEAVMLSVESQLVP